MTEEGDAGGRDPAERDGGGRDRAPEDEVGSEASGREAPGRRESARDVTPGVTREKAEESEALRDREPIWGRLGFRTVVAAVLVLALLVALGLLLGPEYWRF